MGYMSLSEIHWTLGHALSELVPDYLQFLQRIRNKQNNKKEDTGQECTNIKRKVSYTKDIVMWTCYAQKKTNFLYGTRD
jgi:hypothetical protein